MWGAEAAWNLTCFSSVYIYKYAYRDMQNEREGTYGRKQIYAKEVSSVSYLEKMAVFSQPKSP